MYRTALHIGHLALMVLLVWPTGAASVRAQGIIPVQKLSSLEGELIDEQKNFQFFGGAVTHLSDLDGDGIDDVVVGAPSADEGGNLEVGAIWVLRMNRDGTIKAQQQIGIGKGGFEGALSNGDRFGSSVAWMGDLDGDGVQDVAVGAPSDNGQGVNRGAVWLLFLNEDGTVKHHQKISELEGIDGLVLADSDEFGASLANIGDLNGDGVTDLAAGAPFDDTGRPDTGAIWILFMTTDGTVDSFQKISATEGGFQGNLDSADEFGSSLATLGDIDGNGTVELAAGAKGDDDGAGNAGAVWVLSLQPNGTVSGDTKISIETVEFQGELSSGDAFGSALANTGDVNGDQIPDLAVGSPFHEDGTGAVWLLFLKQDGTVDSHQKIDAATEGFVDVLGEERRFGAAVAGIGDRNGDGIPDLLVGSPIDQGGLSDIGAIWLIDLTSTGTVSTHRKVSAASGELHWILDEEDGFGSSVVPLGDLDGDGISDIAVGAPRDDDFAENSGAVWILRLNEDGTVKARQKISGATIGGGRIDAGTRFGASMAAIGDLDQDGTGEIAIGAPFFSENNEQTGAVWVVFLNRDGTARRSQRISGTSGEFDLSNGDTFGASVAGLGDFNVDGRYDIAVGAPRDDDGPQDTGAVWVLTLNADGTVAGHSKISASSGNFDGVLDGEDAFGTAIAGLGDLDGDSILDIAVGAPRDDDGAEDNVQDFGAVWILFLNADGSVKADAKISAIEGNFAHTFIRRDFFGTSLANPGDLDEDGVTDLAVGVPGDDNGLSSDQSDVGAAWILYLNRDGTVKDTLKISGVSGGFQGTLRNGNRFGSSMANLGDINQDGVADIAIGAPDDDDGGTNSDSDLGAVWILFLNKEPGITIQNPSSEPPQTAFEDYRVLVRVSDNDPDSSLNVDVSFRRAGDDKFLTADMDQEPSSQNSFAFDIPGVFVDSRGLEYFVTIKDENGAASRQPPTGIISVPVAIYGEGLVKGSPLPANEYRLISFPMEMDDQSADEIFLDDLGPYEPSEWRLFEPFVSGNRIQYAEYPEISAFTPGKIALIIVKENRFIDSGSGHSIRTDRPFPVALQPGWNLVGSPFNLPVPSTNLSLKSGQPLLMYGYGDVENSPWQLSDTSAVLPFEGYAVFNRNETADTLFIDPLICTEALDENLCPDKWPAEGQPVINENAAWSVRIAARSNGRKDLENAALAHNDADRRWDVLDSPDPPQMGEYISLSFPHEEWGSATANYRVDARPVPDAGDIWTFEVSAGTRENVTLSFDGMESIPGRYRVWLLDEGHAYLQDLRDKAGYSLGTIQINEPVRLNLLVGTDAFIDTLDEHAHPQQFELVQNFPNPFVESTTIRYSIPEGGPVTLEIYDVLGRRLTVLVKASQEVGYHEAAWDGRDQSGIKVASGIYILRLRWKDREKSQMMVRFE